MSTSLRSTAAALLLVVLVSAMAQAQNGPPPAPVQVATAVRHELASYVQVPGTVVSRNQAVISSEVAGQLTWIAEVGDTIRQGAAIARIQDEALQLQLRNDQANIKRLEANLKYVDQQMTRLQRLTEQQIVSANELDEMISQKEAAEQELAAARVRLEQTEFQLSRTTIKAPFGGRVVERLQQPGGYTPVGGQVVRLVDDTHLEVRAQAPLAVAPYVREGMIVAVRDDTREIPSPIRTAIRVGDERSRMFEVRVALEGQPWIVGSPVRVALPTSQPVEVVAVPRDALILRADSIYVFKVTDEGKAERIQVRTGRGDSKLVEVQGEVQDGDRVVVRGGERLRQGQDVEVQAGGSAQFAG